MIIGTTIANTEKVEREKHIYILLKLSLQAVRGGDRPKNLGLSEGEIPAWYWMLFYEVKQLY